MIGQGLLQEKISQQIDENKFPRFALFVGDKGSGRKTFIYWLHSKLPAMEKYVMEDIKIEDVRKMISMAYKMKNTLFCIFDADEMSLPAKNALLKVVEECPNNNHFIMTLQDENNTLDTIKSRAVIYHMDAYTVNEIEQFAGEIVGHSDDIDIIKSVSGTPGDVYLLIQTGARDFYYYVEKVIDNIAEVSGANSFKIADEIALKNEEDKYDLKLFWKIFSKICVDRAISSFTAGEDAEGIRYLMGAKVTSKMLKGLRIKGINKSMLFDIWLLDIRREWME